MITAAAVILHFYISTDSVPDSWHAVPNLTELPERTILVLMAVSPSLLGRLPNHNIPVHDVHAGHGGRQPKLLGETGTYDAGHTVI